MFVKDVMTWTPTTCRPSDTIDTVARLMLTHDCGEIPVCDGPKLVGVITDRDITCRAVATGKTPALVRASEIMTRDVFTIGQDRRYEEALELMEEKLVRRLPVIDAEGRVVGIVSQADLISRTPTLRVARAMKSVARKTRRHTFASL